MSNSFVNTMLGPHFRAGPGCSQENESGTPQKKEAKKR